MINYSDPRHPVWSLCRLTVLMVALTTILAMTADRFDDTEIRTLVTMFLIATGAEGIQQIISRLPKSDSKEQT